MFRCYCRFIFFWTTCFLLVLSLLLSAHHVSHFPSCLFHALFCPQHPTDKFITTVVGENQEEMTVRLALGPRSHKNETTCKVPDFVNTQAINARILCQTLAYPLIRSAVAELFHEDDLQTSLELPSADAYVPLDQKLSFGVVQHLVRLAKGEQSICIGYQNSMGEIVYLPTHHEERAYDKEDRLVVFSRKEINPKIDSKVCCY